MEVGWLRRSVQVARHLDRHLLRWIFRFDAWHVGHAGEAYARRVVEFLNGWAPADRGAVVEIGCGLGDILRRLRFRTRLGLDRDPRVLAAARFLALLTGHWRLAFRVFDFPEAALDGRYHAIVLVNWIHEVAPERLRTALRAYYAAHLEPGGAIIVDTVRDPAYTYNHEIEALAPSGAMVLHLGRFARQRDVWAIVKPRAEDGRRPG
jgi:cyclopropane fatty-acyl-phospholipid synthase-like methyltransferase